MNIELIMKSDVLDIIFDKRNKAYGAYTLRKFYNNRLIKSLGAMLIAVMLFSAFTFLPGRNSVDTDYVVTEAGFVKILPPPKVPILKPKPKLASILPGSPSPLLRNILIVDQLKPADTVRNLIEAAPINSGVRSNVGTGQGMSELPGSGAGDEPARPAEAVEPAVDKANPINNPEVMPEFPGGINALRRFLERNLRNPRDLEDGELISVKVMFVVGYDGKLQRFEVIQDGGKEFNNEVIRVLKQMPAWVPGKSRGQNVSVFYTIPVKFVPES